MRPRRTRLVLSLVVAAATAGSACSSDSTSSSDSTVPAVASVVAPPASATPGSGGDATTAASTASTAGSTASTGSGSTGPAPTTPKPVDSGSITHWQHHSDARAALVEQFISSYADDGGAKVDFESIPYSDYFTRLGAALEAGSGPCVFQLPANILAEFQKRGELARVPDDVMTAAQMEATFTPASIKLLKVEGQYYGMPTDVQTMLLFYNDDLFKAAGLDPTKDFATWEELRQAAIKLTKTDGGSMSQAGIDITSSPYQFYYAAPTLAFKDGVVNDDTLKVNYASDPGYQVWQRLTDLVTKDHVDDPEFLAEQSKFGTGLAGMTMKEYTFNGVYKLSAPDVHFSVHVAPPVADEQFAEAASTSWSYAVSSDCDNQAGAWNWIQYLTSEASQRIWIAQGGELPSRLALLDDPTLAADPSVAVGFEALANAVPYDSIGWDDAFAVQQEIWDEIVVGGTNVKTAVDTGAAAENALYASKGVTK